MGKLDERELMIKGMISALDLPQQARVQEIKSQLKAKYDEAPPEFKLALDLTINEICLFAQSLLKIFETNSSQ